MPNFCPTCGKQLQFENAEICPACGVRIQPPPIPTEIRSPFLAIVLSFFFTGWGQWYNGKTIDGWKLLGAFFASYIVLALFSVMVPTQPFAAILVIIMFLILLGIWIYGMYEAYQTADKINKKEETFSGKSGWFWLPVALIALAVLFIFAAVLAAFVFGMAGNVSP
ncbi:zinc ribbon domain-containing protein [Methanoregula sp.]|uniref:zinc ribbon domain-containing protein n=1 Tax=Methanoregula sp. TaxID=2052170 RepID=UPI00262C0237|nr:zinc ribbon domain-containing protein [Methanoregula sp.]MDD5142359.1 zinc ribbon domain-containing protein [Methanoregula sp.]